jgi:hypothetical protein
MWEMKTAKLFYIFFLYILSYMLAIEEETRDSTKLYDTWIVAEEDCLNCDSTMKIAVLLEGTASSEAVIGERFGIKFLNGKVLCKFCGARYEQEFLKDLLGPEQIFTGRALFVLASDRGVLSEAKSLCEIERVRKIKETASTDLKT